MGRDVEKVFIETVRREALFPGGSRVIAAVSGGGDSLALLRLLARFSNHMDWTLSVLHVDHRLREGSGEDACFVCSLAEEMGLPFRLLEPEGPDGGSAEGEWSRIRQAVYEEEAAREGGLIAVGHTASDRAETLLMRLMEGSGLRGLGGMDYRGRGPVRRPLLDLTSGETRGYLESLGQRWLEDPSNLDTAMLRNRVRLEVMPRLEGVYPGAVLGLARAAAGLSDWRRTAFDAVEEAAAGLTGSDGGAGRLDRGEFEALPGAVRRALLWELAGRPRKGRLELEKTEKWLSSGGRGSRDLPGGTVLEADREEIRFFPAGEEEVE